MERMLSKPLSLVPESAPASEWRAIEGFKIENGVFNIVLLRDIGAYVYSPQHIRREYLTKQEFRHRYGDHPKTYPI